MNDLWNSRYQGKIRDTFAYGGPSIEIVDLAGQLSTGYSILDLGCGDGRNALFLAEKGCSVTCVDFSEEALKRLHYFAELKGLAIETYQRDLCNYNFINDYDLIIAHGVLHFLKQDCWTRLIEDMKIHTRIGGYNVVAVFTDRIPAAEHVKERVGDLFKEGELFELYADWHIVAKKSYIKEENPPDQEWHQHPINKIVAQKRG